MCGPHSRSHNKRARIAGSVIRAFLIFIIVVICKPVAPDKPNYAPRYQTAHYPE
nr:MAG TPA: hypothetical protein [Caudoviricetes sp.]